MCFHLHDIVKSDHFGARNRRLIWPIARKQSWANSQATAEAYRSVEGRNRRLKVIHNGFQPAHSPRFKKSMRLAIVHDYLIQMGGAERVVAAMAETFPKAPMILTSVTDTKRRLPEFRDHHIVNTWMDALSGIRKHFKKYFTLFPAAFRSVGPVGADVAWINSSGFAHWLPLDKNIVNICYCHPRLAPSHRHPAGHGPSPSS